MIIARSIEKKDIEAFYRLAAILDTYNLPKNKEALKKIIRQSLNSFKGEIEDNEQKRYVFVAEDTDTKQIVGTSEIVARRGRKGFPFIYCSMGVDRMHSKTLNKTIHHPFIKLASTEKGFTEIGGLIAHPKWRRGIGIGKILSYVRFMYMKSHPSFFQKDIRAELLAYLSPKGENPLWNVLGKHFTSLDYREADHLSAHNKEFILSLFPSTKIYTCLLPENVNRILGKPGAQTIPAQKLLENIGFRYLKQIDPFDGGPLYGAQRSKVLVYKNTKALRVGPTLPAKGRSYLILQEQSNGQIVSSKMLGKKFRRFISLEKGKSEQLGIQEGTRIWAYRI